MDRWLRLLDERPALRLALPIAALLLAAALFVTSVGRCQYPWINHDVAVYVHTARAMLDGKVLYVDWLETNPPTIHVLSVAVVGLARAIGASDIALYHLAVLALGGFGLVVIARSHADDRPGWARLLLELGYVLVVVRGGAVEKDFAQREHLFALALLPYVAVRLGDLPLRPLVAASVALVGLLAGMKPQFVALVVAFEALARFVGEADLRRQGWTIAWLAGPAALPIALLGVFSPGSLGGLFGTIVPLHLSGRYGVVEGSFTEFVTSPAHSVYLALVVTLLVASVIAARRGTGTRFERWTALILVPLGYLVVVQQGKYFTYHGAILFGLLVLLGARALADAATGTGKGRVVLGVAGLALLAAHAHTLYWRYGETQNDYPKMAGDMARVIAPRSRVMVVSWGLDYIYGPLHLELDLVNRWPHDVIIPSYVREPDVEERERVLAEHAREYRDLIRAQEPEWVLVEPYARAKHGGLTVHELLVTQRNAIPLEDYALVPAQDLPAFDGFLTGWFLYRRR